MSKDPTSPGRCELTLVTLIRAGIAVPCLVGTAAPIHAIAIVALSEAVVVVKTWVIRSAAVAVGSTGVARRGGVVYRLIRPVASLRSYLNCARERREE